MDDDNDDMDEDRSMFGYSTGLGPLADFGELGERQRAAARARRQPGRPFWKIVFGVESRRKPDPDEDR
jgi:hypothetical protein